MSFNHEMSAARGRRAIRLVGVAAFICLAAGCGGSAGTADVSGKVTLAGQPVTGGSLTFAPVASGDDVDPGRPASAEISPDGTFSMEGATVGKVRVTYSAPYIEEPDGETRRGRKPKPSPYTNLVPKQAEAEVTDGGQINIELVAPGRSR